MVMALDNIGQILGSGATDTLQSAAGDQRTAGSHTENPLGPAGTTAPLHRGTWAELCPLPSGLTLPLPARTHENAFGAALSLPVNKTTPEEPSLLTTIGKSVASFVGSLVESAPELAHSLLPFAAVLGGAKLAGGLAVFGIVAAGYHLASDIKGLFTAKDSKERMEALKGIGRKLGLMATLFGFAKERGVFSGLLSVRSSAAPAEPEDKAG